MRDCVRRICNNGGPIGNSVASDKNIYDKQADRHRVPTSVVTRCAIGGDRSGGEVWCSMATGALP
jgi:hypothetical protein